MPYFAAMARLPFGRALLVAFCCNLLHCLPACAQSASPVWATKWDVNYFISRKTGFSSDSRYYAIGDNKGNVTIYRTDSMGIYATCHEHNKQVFCSLFQPGGTLIASGDKDGIVVLYDYVQQAKKLSINTGQGAITAMAFSRDGTLLATGSRDNSYRIYDPATGRLLHELHGIKGNILAMRITPDNKKLVLGTGALSFGVKVYDIATGAELFQLPTDNLVNMDLSPNGKFLAIAQLDKTLTVFDLQGKAIATMVSGLHKHLADIAYDPENKFVLCGSEDKCVLYWDFATMQEIVRTKRPISGIALAPDGIHMAVMCDDGTLTMWEVHGPQL